MSRRETLSRNLEQVRERIRSTCAEAGRPVEEVELVVVTKFFPTEDVELLIDLGVRAVGESRDQEATVKLASFSRRDQLKVHFVGRVQSNKASSIARYADVVHSLDRPKLVRALDRGAEAAGRSLDVLIQVSLDDDDSRGGARSADVPPLAEQVHASDHLRLRGVMAVAPSGADPDESFRRLRSVAHGIRASHPEATWISAGMSADLEAAVRNGATHLRVGSAILGSRPPLG